MADSISGGKVIVMVFDGNVEDLAQRIIDGAYVHPLRVTTISRAAAVRGAYVNTKLAQAEQFLRDTLADGPIQVQDIIGGALDAGIGSYTLRVAKKRIGAKSVKAPGLGSPWTWVMPD